jgi:hypothetical protein
VSAPWFSTETVAEADASTAPFASMARAAIVC